MICHLRRVSNEEIDELLANPQEVVFFLFGPVVPTKPGLLARWFGRARRGIHCFVKFSDWDGKELKR